MASTRERIAGRPSGTAATASETPSRRTVTASSAVETPLRRATAAITTTAITTTMMPSDLETAAISRCSGVGSDSVLSRRPAMAPISVSIPVAVTTARPTPCTTPVPLWTMLRRSPRAVSAASAAADFSVASDSPVSDASWTFSPVAARIRASAPIASPSASTRTSPITRSADGIVTSRPSRTTVEFAAVIDARAATASSARASSTNPMAALRRTMTAITIASTGTPAAPSTTQAATEMTMATSSRMTSGSRNWARMRRHNGTGGAERSSLGPSRSRRRRASDSVRPWSGSTSRSPTTSSQGR